MTKIPGKSASPAGRKAQRGAALRENLLRRKAQSRARAVGEADESGDAGRPQRPPEAALPQTPERKS